VPARGDDRRGLRFDDVADVGVWKTLAQCPHGRRGEDDVANLTEADE
jgi:hypothetical protein